MVHIGWKILLSVSIVFWLPLMGMPIKKTTKTKQKSSQISVRYFVYTILGVDDRTSYSYKEKADRLVQKTAEFLFKKKLGECFTQCSKIEIQQQLTRTIITYKDILEAFLQAAELECK